MLPALPSFQRAAEFRNTCQYLEALSALSTQRQRPPDVQGRATGLRGQHRCQRLLDQLGNPEKKLKYVHVTGTSGKGTVARGIHAVLQASGVLVGSFTSPHICSPLERILIGEHLLEPEFWNETVRSLKAWLDEEYVHGPYGVPTYFELVFAIALSAFVQRAVEIAVVEVGIGGRLDTSNVIPAPLLAIITHVGFDHMDILGSTTEAIATEKAGIIKRGCVALSGATQPEARSVIQKVARIEAVPLYELEEMSVDERNYQLSLYNTEQSLRIPEFPAVLFPRENGCMIAAAARLLQLQHVHLDDAAVSRGISDTYLPGRYETIQVGPATLVLDMAHNEDKIRSFVTRWLREGVGGCCLLALAADKNAGEILKQLSECFDQIVLTQPLSAGRKMITPHRLLELALPLGLPVEIKLDPWEALSDKLEAGVTRIAVVGSAYLVGEVRQRFDPEEDIIARKNIKRYSEID